MVKLILILQEKFMVLSAAQRQQARKVRACEAGVSERVVLLCARQKEDLL